MKKIVYILVLILVSFGLKAQTLPSGAPSPNSPTGYSLVGYVRSGKAFVWTKTDTTFTATYPSVVWSPDGNFYKTDGGSGSHWSLWIPATPTLGTVTSVATNNGTGITGGTITSTGTLANDTTLLSTRLWRQKGIDSLIGLINLKLNISDTTAMLSNLLRKTDTATMLNGYARSGNVVPNTRTINTNSPLTGGGTLSSDLTLVADTGRANAQLVSGGSLNKVRDSLQANITAAVSGVSSVSTTDNYGISSSVANPTSTPNISIGVDTSLIVPYTDTLKVNGIATKTDVRNSVTGGTVTSIATTNGILGGTITTTGTLQVDSSLYSTKAYVLKIASDTSTSLRTLINTKGTGNGTVTSVAAGTGMSFTTITTTGTVNADTSVLSTKAYVLKVASDTSISLRTLINTKGTGNGTVTSVALSLPSFITVSGSPITTSGTLTGTLANQTANLVFASPTTGSAAQPTFRALVAADLPDSYLPISDTASMLSNRLKISDTATMLEPFVKLRGDSMYGSLKIHGTGNVIELFKDNNLPTISFNGTTTSSVLEGGDDMSLYTNGIKNFYVTKEGGVYARNSLTTGTSGIVIGDGSANAGAPISFLGALTTRNWQISSQLKISDGIAFTPSTTIGGADFIGTPVFTLVGSTRTGSFSDSLFAKDLEITGTGILSQMTTTGFDNYQYNINASIPPLGKITKKYVDSLISISGTVTNVSGTWALSFINSNTMPIGSIDTLWGGVLTKKQGYNALDSGLYLKLNISDTSTMLSGYVPYKNATGTVDLNTQLIKAGTAQFSPSGTPVTINSTAGDALLLTKTAGNPTISLGSPTTTYSLFETQIGGGLKIYTGNGTQSVALSLDASQNEVVTGSITGNSIIKSGATSSQALIGDGSVLTVASTNTASAIVQRDGSGNIYGQAIQTDAPSGSTARLWKFGDYTAGSATQTGYIAVEINGSVYYLLALIPTEPQPKPTAANILNKKPFKLDVTKPKKP